MIDLAIKQVTEGLSAADQRALDEQGGAARALLRDFEKAAAAINLAASRSPEPLPAQLLKRLEGEGAKFFNESAGRTAADNVVPLTARSAAPAVRQRRGGVAGWFAAAACLLLAVFFWARTPRELAQPPVAIDVSPPPIVVRPPAPPAPPSAAALRDALLARGDSIKVTLGATKDPAAAGVSGDVVWDPVAQTGFLHFVGLAPNDPRVRQYQAWIFDKERDARYPVDAGLFDVSPDATEIVIPIHASVPVQMAAAFAVTLEKAGGAVVSARDHLVLLGKVS